MDEQRLRTVSIMGAIFATSAGLSAIVGFMVGGPDPASYMYAGITAVWVVVALVSFAKLRRRRAAR